MAITTFRSWGRNRDEAIGDGEGDVVLIVLINK